jgi:YfiH family protein
VLQVPGWERIPQLVHGFCGRRGGVSCGVYAELNLSSRVGDETEAVRENWQRATAVSGGGMHFTTMHQVHGTDVVTVVPGMTHAGEADAMVTAAAGVALSVLTADCVPILLVAPQQRVAAAVHAGWRGTVAGIAARAVQHMQWLFKVEPDSLHAALGPAIGGCCYEVDRAIVDELEQRWGALPGPVRSHTHKPRLDLRRANAAMLMQVGVREAHISHVGPCTRCATAEYFSYRAVGGETGRQLSFIGWRGTGAA